VGIDPSRVTIVERLPMFSQRMINNFDVTPFVAVIEPGELRIDSSETASVFTVPLETIVGEGLREDSVEHRGLRVQSLVLDYEGYRIWGFTARILETFVSLWKAGELRERVNAALR